MSEAARADSRAAIGVRHDIENDVVRPQSITRYSAYSQQMVETQIVASAPSDIMIGAGSIAAHPNGAEQHFSRSIQRQPSAEHVHAADLLPHHGVNGRAVL